MSTEMGNHENKAADGQEFYCLRQREIRLMSEIWKSVETDIVHYGTQFYSLLFHNHPEYMKFFQGNVPHEFQVDIPAIRTKFSLTCGTLAALFVEYSHKSEPRENLLGYVAMVHKDMNLTQKDMENFMLDVMEMLMQNFPKLMTADCCLAYMRYTASITSRIYVLMEKQREISRLNEELSPARKKNSMVGCFRLPIFDWLPCRDQHLIYGRPAEYWEKKSQNWIVQHAVWATMNRGERSHSSGRDSIPMKSTRNISQWPSSEVSTSSDDQARDPSSEKPKKHFIATGHQWSNSDQEINKSKTRKKKQFRKQKYLSIISTDIDREIASRSSDFSKGDTRPIKPRVREFLNTTHPAKIENISQVSNDEKINVENLKTTVDDYHIKGANRGRLRRVSIVNSTARERRRRNNREGINPDDRYPRSVKIGINIVKNQEDSSSIDEHDEKNFRQNLRNSPNLGINRMRDRGTSISNMPKQSNKNGEKSSIERSYTDGKLRTSFSVKNHLPSSIIGSGTTAGRNIKTNKRVSISNAHWTESSELYK